MGRRTNSSYEQQKNPRVAFFLIAELASVARLSILRLLIFTFTVIVYYWIDTYTNMNIYVYSYMCVCVTLICCQCIQTQYFLTHIITIIKYSYKQCTMPIYERICEYMTIMIIIFVVFRACDFCVFWIYIYIIFMRLTTLLLLLLLLVCSKWMHNGHDHDTVIVAFYTQISLCIHHAIRHNRSMEHIAVQMRRKELEEKESTYTYLQYHELSLLILLYIRIRSYISYIINIYIYLFIIYCEWR